MALDPRRVHLEAFLLANAGGPIDQRKNTILGKVMFAFPIEPDEVREVAALARETAADRSPQAKDPFTPLALYTRICEVAWEDGDIDGDRSRLEPLRHALEIDPTKAEQLLEAAKSAPIRPPPGPRAAVQRPPRPPAPDSLILDGPPRTYTLSERFTATGLVMTLVGGTLGAALLGVAYGLITWYNPVLQLGALLPLGLGLAVGWAVGKLARAIGVRNRRVVALAAVVSGVVSDYFAFVMWVSCLSLGKAFILYPPHLSYVLGRVLEKGVWSMSAGSEPVRGSALAFLWVVELVMVLGVAYGTAFRFAFDGIFCERCLLWNNTPELRYLAPELAAERLTQLLAQGDLRELHGLQPVPHDSHPSLKLGLLRCPRCTLDPHISVHWRDICYVNGTATWNEKPLVQNLAISLEAQQILFG
jgi:hypothetical protein